MFALYIDINYYFIALKNDLGQNQFVLQIKKKL